MQEQEPCTIDDISVTDPITICEDDNGDPQYGKTSFESPSHDQEFECVNHRNVQTFQGWDEVKAHLAKQEAA